MKTVNQIWDTLPGDNRDNLVAGCRDIMRWHKTGILPEGIVRQFAEQLTLNEFRSYYVLSIAEDHIKTLAMEFTINNLE